MSRFLRFTTSGNIHYLDRIKRYSGDRLSPQELTVLCLLVMPDHFEQYPGGNPLPLYLAGCEDERGHSWKWGDDDMDDDMCDEPKALLKSKGFLLTEAKVKGDRKKPL